MIRKFASVRSRWGGLKKLAAIRNDTNRKKITATAPRVASTSIDRLLVWPELPVSAMLCARPIRTNAPSGSAAGGILISIRFSTMTFAAQSNIRTTTISSKMATDQASTVPSASVVKTTAASKPQTIALSRRLLICFDGRRTTDDGEPPSVLVLRRRSSVRGPLGRLRPRFLNPKGSHFSGGSTIQTGTRGDILRSRLPRAADFNECKGTYTCESSHQRGVMRPSLAD